jgi:hypothetical protein
MGSTRDPFQDLAQFRRDATVGYDSIAERLELRLRRQLAIEQQISDFFKSRMLRKVFDRIA